jgi:hypothetical protein
VRPLVLIVCICIVKPPPVSRFHPWSHLDDQRGDSTPEDEELLAVSDPKLVASEAVSLPPTASTSDPLPSPSLPALLLSELRPPPPTTLNANAADSRRGRGPEAAQKLNQLGFRFICVGDGVGVSALFSAYRGGLGCIESL